MKVQFIHIHPDRAYGLSQNKQDKQSLLLPDEVKQEMYADKIFQSMCFLIKKAMDLSKAPKTADDNIIFMVATPEFFYYTPKGIMISDQIFIEKIINRLKQHIKELPSSMLCHFGSLCVEAGDIIRYELPPPNIVGGYQEHAFSLGLSQFDVAEMLSQDKKQNLLGKKFFNIAIYGQCGTSGKVGYYSKQHPFRLDAILEQCTQVVMKEQNSFFVSQIQKENKAQIGHQLLICFDTQFAEAQKAQALAQNDSLPDFGFTHVVGQGACLEEASSFYTLAALVDYETERTPDLGQSLVDAYWPISKKMFFYKPCDVGKLKEEIRELFVRKQQKKLSAKLVKEFEKTGNILSQEELEKKLANLTPEKPKETTYTTSVDQLSESSTKKLR